MSDTPTEGTPLSQDLAPPSNDRMLPPSPLGIPLFARIRNASRAAQHDSFVELEAAINRRLAWLDEQVRLKAKLIETTAYYSGRLSRIDLIREDAVLDLQDEIAGKRRRAKIAALTDDAEIARLEEEVRKARGQPTSKEPAAPKRSSVVDRYDELLGEVKEIEKFLDAQIASILEAVGGEENLTEDQRQHIDYIREVKARKVADLFEAMAQ